MEFNEFVENITAMLQDKMGEEYEVKVTNVTKNNDIRLTGIVMMRGSDSISPTVYLEEPYQLYCAGTGMQEIADRIIAVYQERMQDMDFDINFFRDFERVKDRIYHKLINYEKNRNLLKDVPHIRWHDLAVVFYYAVEEKIFGKASILIHNNHLDMWVQTTDMMYRLAQHNMRQSMQELLVPMQELIEDLTGVRTRETDDDEIRLYVLTNREKLYGASAVLYSDQIKELADNLQADLLILPSSVHEVLLLPDDKDNKYDFYINMVEEVNMTQVEPEEVLSFSLYRYCREKSEIEEISV